MNFRPFPGHLSEEGMVKGTILDCLGNMLGLDSLGSCQVTCSSAHLDNPNANSFISFYTKDTF